MKEYWTDHGLPGGSVLVKSDDDVQVGQRVKVRVEIGDENEVYDMVVTKKTFGGFAAR